MLPSDLLNDDLIATVEQDRRRPMDDRVDTLWIRTALIAQALKRTDAELKEHRLKEEAYFNNDLEFKSQHIDIMNGIKNSVAYMEREITNVKDTHTELINKYSILGQKFFAVRMIGYGVVGSAITLWFIVTNAETLRHLILSLVTK